MNDGYFFKNRRKAVSLSLLTEVSFQILLERYQRSWGTWRQPSICDGSSAENAHIY